MTKKSRRVSHPIPYLAQLDDQMVRLRQVESRMDGLFRQVVNDLDEQALARASERFDDLVLAFPELRVPNLEAYPREVAVLLSRLDLQFGPLPGFEEAMERLCALAVTPQVLCALRSRLFKIAALAAENCAELLPTVAVASQSIESMNVQQNPFLEMVIFCSAIESYVCTSLVEYEPLSVDVSTWLATDPTDALIAAVGEGLAYYYAPIPGVLPFLDRSRVLFDIEQLVPVMCASSCARSRDYGQGLDALVDQAYKAVLSGEIQRAQQELRQRYPAPSIADVEMLTRRALDALDDLPPRVNPLLQAIFVQSWVRYLYEAE